ncbi:ATP-binding protein [Caballeronia sp. dw_276]|uniref:ATP-binding protein n=1 Tax=Caballeronia sp. dw_276 TaxID=2719795 RepID=UPI001BD258A1|nr:ATP-binding protein [Caballeronia sp. dw_276]
MCKKIETALSEHVRIANHYQRSIRLDADYGRMDALDGYLCHGTAHAVLDNMTRQLIETNQRAFTWTGPFGGGKSSLALALASAVGRDRALRAKARKSLGVEGIASFDAAMPIKRGGWLILPIVGKRGSVVREIARTAAKALGQEDSVDLRKVSGVSVIESLCQAADDKRFDGVMLIIDEMGKFLEASATGGDDVYFFQELAEAAARASGRFVVVGILHQSFRQYATRLGLDSRDDWAKVQGRFSDISLVAANDEVVQLLAKAVESDFPHPSTASVAADIASAIQRRRPMLGDGFGNTLDECWPLHPTMAVLLGPVSKRQFGQNERSTFGFLASVEPYGFRAFLIEHTARETSWYQPDHYWDFLRANLEPAILASPDGHRWAQAVEAVERAQSRGGALHISLIKNIAIIDLFRSGSGLAAEPAILKSLHPLVTGDEVQAALAELDRWRVAIFRKHIGAWSVFEGSDFDIDVAVSDARGSLPALNLELLTQLANLHPVVAKRHYSLKGTLRWMSTSICHLDDVLRVIDRYEPVSGEFGQFLLVLPPRDMTLRGAKKHCLSFLEAAPNKKFSTVLGLPNNYARIHELGVELLALQSVQSNRPELEGDPVARREMSARTAAVRTSLEEALRGGLAGAFWLGSTIEVTKDIRLSALASSIADELYKKAPSLHNELVNRDSLSSSSVKARRDLLHRMLLNEGEEALAIEGYPAERGLYQSLLASTGLHAYDEGENRWRFVAPSSGSPSRQFVPLWTATKKMFSGHERRVDLSEIYSRWSAVPFGLRSGVHPILFLAFINSHKDSIAVYKDGMFVPGLSDADVDECLQDPRRFSLRWVTVDQDRAAILSGIASILGAVTGNRVIADPLEAARAMVSLVIELPAWVKRTQTLSEEARAVRDLLYKANDPHKILFVDLMTLLGARNASEYVKKLKRPLQELTVAYKNMLQGMSDRMIEALDASADDLDGLRKRAVGLVGVSGDFRLDAFATRIASYQGTKENLEGVLSLAANKPPRDWNDRDVDTALLAIAEWALRFKQVEVLLSVQRRAPTREAFAIVIGAGKDSKAFSRTFDIAARDLPTVNMIATSLLSQMTGKGLKTEILLAALAQAGMSLTENNKEESHG